MAPRPAEVAFSIGVPILGYGRWQTKLKSPS